MVYSTNQSLQSLVPQSVGRSIPNENALKLQFIQLGDYDIYCSNITVNSTPGLLAQGVNPFDTRYQLHNYHVHTGIYIYETTLVLHIIPSISEYHT